MNKVDYALYLIADPSFCLHHRLDTVVAQAITHGVSLVQLRAKQASTAERIRLGRTLQPLLQQKNIPLIINDDLKAALALGAGLHVGQSDCDVNAARQQLGTDKILGLSIENTAQFKRDQNSVADYFGVGPIFATQSKKDAAPAIGLATLANICAQSAKPIVAIGGINSDNVGDVQASGVAGIAILSAICSAKNIANACQAFSMSVTT